MMGLFDTLFGSVKKTAPKKSARALDKRVAPISEVVISEDTKQPKPEIVAAICASINMIMDDDAELAAAVIAAIIHARRKRVTVLRIKRTSDAWAAIGRQKLMDARQSV